MITSAPEQRSSARPIDLLFDLARSVGWTGTQQQVAVAAFHRDQGLSFADYAEALRNLGLIPHAERRALASLSDMDVPCLVELDDGRIGLAERVDPGGLWLVMEGWPTAMRIKPKGAALVLLVAAPDEEAETTRGPTRALMAKQKKSLRTIVALSLIVNVIGLVFPFIVLTVYDTAIPTRSNALLLSLAQVAVLFLTLDIALRVLRSWLVGSLGARVEKELSQALFEKLTWLPMRNIQAAPTFQQVQRIKQFDSIRDSLTGSFLLTAIDAPFSLVYLGVIALFAPYVAAFIAGGLVVFVLAALVITKQQVSQAAQTASLKLKYDTLIHETSMRLGTIRSFALGEDLQNRLFTIEAAASRAFSKQRITQAYVEAGGQALVGFIGVGAVALTTLGAIDGSVSFGALIVVITLVWRILSTFKSLLMHGQKYVSLIATMRQADSALTQDEEMRRHGLQSRSKRLDAPLEIKGAFLRYNAVNEPALINVSFKIEKGSLVALAGASGSGKSTLLNCFAKLVSPSTGSVMISSIDYRQLAVEDVRNSVSLACSDPWFFPLSLRDNMRIGNPGLSDDHIIDMFDLIGTSKDLRGLHDGLDTVMDRATLGGLTAMQKRSLNAVRALCSSASIYLLDDAVAGLSARRADRLWRGLETLKGSKTIIVATNRLEDMRRADRVIAMQGGRVAIDATGPEAAQKALMLWEGQ
ncbi:MAG: ATP-binding cassette domain-containing protein [Pseudomonadota bacterium]